MCKGQKNYLVSNATEYVLLYCKSIAVLNLSVFAVYIFYRKTCGFLVLFFCHIFSGKNFFQFICTMFIIKHRLFSYTLFVNFSSKMEYAILLSTSLGHGVMEPVFFILALPWLTCVRSKCKCKSKPWQCVRTCLCICFWMCWCCSCVYLLALAFVCEPSLIFGL